MRKVFITLVFTLLLCSNTEAQFTEALPRHAYWGASFSGPTEERAGAQVNSIIPATFAETIDLKQGDIIFKVNGVFIKNPTDFHEMFYGTKYVKGGSQVSIEILRNGVLIQKKGIVPSKPLESFNGVITEYKSIMSPLGYKVQVIITRPETVKEKIPGVFLVRWMSCDPIEKPVSRKHGVARLLDDFIQKSGYAVIRVEKSGLGDSEGPSCYNADFKHELAAHQAAYRAFTQLEFIDQTKIIVLAQSNGAAYAPLVTEGKEPAAFVVSGGWAKSWYEHMLEFKRKIYEWNGTNADVIHQRMGLEAEFYTEYLIKKKLPGDVLKEKPHLKIVWDDEYSHQWKLPAAYLHQLQDLNVAAGWAKVKSPTYIFFGEYDIAMVESDHKKIAEMVKANGGSTVYEFVPKMDHSLFWFETREKSMQDFYGNGSYNGELATRIFKWLEDILK